MSEDPCRARFETLLSRTGVPVTSKEQDDLFEAYGLLEEMLKRVRLPLPPEAGIALLFLPARPVE